MNYLKLNQTILLMSILLVSLGITLAKGEEKVQEREEKADFHSEQSK